MTKHTPHNEEDQWVAVGTRVEYTNPDVADICSCNPQDFGQESVAISHEQQCSNAKHIVKCVSLHDDLVNALNSLLVGLDDSDDKFEGQSKAYLSIVAIPRAHTLIKIIKDMEETMKKL